MIRIVLPAAALFVVAALVLTGCESKDGAQTSSTTAAASGSEIVVGEVGSMTGSDATFGQGEHKAIMLAFDEINAHGGIKGKKLDFFVVTYGNFRMLLDGLLGVTWITPQVEAPRCDYLRDR